MKAQTVPVLTIEIVVHIESRLNHQLSSQLVAMDSPFQFMRSCLSAVVSLDAHGCLQKATIVT